MNAGIVGEVLAGLFVVAIVYVLVRPNSQGTALITAFTGALTAIVRNATDLAAE